MRRRLPFAGVIAACVVAATLQAAAPPPGASGPVVTRPDFDLAGAPARGPADAPVTIVLFSDFQCGFCARTTGVLERVLAQYRDDVRLVFKHFPLSFHRAAPLAHRAALAAHAQGRFWPMHDAIFANQRALSRDDLLQRAASLGLDRERFVAALDDSALGAVVERDRAEGARAGVDGTPTCFVDGEPLVGAQPYEAFAAAIERALERARPGQRVERAMSYGPARARVTIEWFGDLTSPLHREALTLLRPIVASHPEDVRVVLRLLASADRPQAPLIHRAAIAAAEQFRFWEMHDVLMTRASTSQLADLAGYAERLGLARPAFLAAIEDDRSRQKLDRDADEARRREVRGTPTFFVNQVRVDGLVEPSALERIVAAALGQ